MFRRRSDPPPITRDEVTHLIVLMRVEWKLDLILEELEIESGEEEG